MHVVLIESHLVGHRPTYLYIYSRLLIELGHSVSIICAEEDKCRDFIVTEKGLTPVGVYPLLNYLTQNPLLTSRDYYHKYILWKRLKHSIAAIKNVDFIFFMYFDDFIFDFNDFFFWPKRINHFLNRFLNKYYLPKFIDECLPVSWSGILFHPILHKWKEYNQFFRSHSNSSICLLDETWELSFTVKKQFSIPDITDEQNSEELTQIASSAFKKANGRKIISLLGSLEKRKGLLPLLDAIEGMDPQIYFFLVAGKLDVTFTKDELNRLSHFKNNVDNCFFILDGIPTENDFNSLVKITDIMYLAYIGFYHSSNLLTKASLFKKPVLVTQHMCMGKRVQQFKTGICIADHNATTIINALNNFNMQFDPSKAQFDKYFSLHSVAHLKRSLDSIIKFG